jgi:hypothetical protein
MNRINRKLKDNLVAALPRCVLRASSAAGGEIILLQYSFAIMPNISK